MKTDSNDPSINWVTDFSYKSPWVSPLIGLQLILLAACGGSSDDGTPMPPPPPTAQNNAPVAQAGADQAASATVRVLLDGSGSTDADSDPITYAWTLAQQPATSQSILDDSTLAQPRFTPDVAGAYIIDLVVSDGTDTSTADQVIITVTDNSASQMIGAAGGEVVSADGLMTLTVPAEALANDENITITLVTPDQQDAFLGDEFDGIGDIETVYNLTPDGLAFAMPVNVNMKADGNPVIDSTTLGGAMQFLITSDGTTAELLGDLTINADADTASITVSGTLEHFSPLVYSPHFRNEMSSQDFFTWNIAGVPDIVVSGEMSTVTASIESAIVRMDITDYLDTFNIDSSNSGVFEPIGLDDGRGAMVGTDVSRSLDIQYQCSKIGTITYKAFLFMRTFEAADQPPEISSVFDDSITTVIATKQVTCEAAPPPPSNRIQAGINSVPASLTDIEAVQVGLLLNLLIIDAVGSVSNDPHALFASAQGWILYNLVLGVVVLNGSSPDATEPTFGIQMVSSELPNGNIAGMFFRHGTGTFGSTQCDYDPVEETLFNFCQAYQGTGFDANPVGNTHNTTQMTYTTTRSVGVIELDTTTERYIENEFVPAGSIRATARSTVRLDLTGPLLVLSASFSPDSFLSLVETDGTVTEVGVFPDADARKIRCVDNLCAITVFDDGAGQGALRLLTWDGLTEPTIIDTPIVVGDGPVSTDLIALLNGNYLIVSTGFNDHTVSLTEVTAAGVMVSSNTSPAPTGCMQPAHAAFFIPDGVAEEAQVVGTCFASNQYFVLDITNGAQGFEIVSLP